MKDQTWYKITGADTNTETIIVSLIGVKNGEATSVAIMLAPAGNCLISGADTS
ncbi:hypothetical protein D3C72_1464460 [compost metagenome]